MKNNPPADKAQLLRSLSPFARAYLVTALWSSRDAYYFTRKIAQDAGWSVHVETVDGAEKWVHVAPGENGADFVHEFDWEHEAWEAACEEAGLSLPHDGHLDAAFSVSDFSVAALARAVADCAKFERENGEAIERAIATGEVVCGPDFNEWERAGHDFWLSRNGHGAGFFDGDWPDPYGDTLENAARGFRELNPYVSDAREVEFE